MTEVHENGTATVDFDGTSWILNSAAVILESSQESSLDESDEDESYSDESESDENDTDEGMD